MPSAAAAHAPAQAAVAAPPSPPFAGSRRQLPYKLAASRAPACPLQLAVREVAAEAAPSTTGQPHGRVFNFSAGPAVLPVEVLEQAQADLLNWRGSGGCTGRRRALA